MSLKNKATTALLVALTGAMLPLGAQAQTVPLKDIDYTDVWWNPQRSGWGMNLVQQQKVLAYASLHDYKADGTPTWYVASLILQLNGSFAGEIYRHTSAPVSAPLTTSQISGAPVGNFVFTPISATQAKIAYTIDGQQDEQTITRFTFTSQPFEIKNDWDDGLTLARVLCPNSPMRGSWRISTVPPSFTRAPNGTTAVKIDLSAGCSISGTLITEGRFGHLDGAQLVCTPSIMSNLYAGPAVPVPTHVTLESLPSRIEARWVTDELPASIFFPQTYPILEGSCVERGIATYTDYPD